MNLRDAQWYADTFGTPKDVWVNSARGAGMPGLLLLHQFGRTVFEAFGVYPWLVGSALTEREPHDIDVRLVLSGAEFKQFCWPGYGTDDVGTAWGAFNLAFAILGRHMTGLSVDFQIQNTAIAGSEKFKNSKRLVLGGWFVEGMAVMVPLRSALV